MARTPLEKKSTIMYRGNPRNRFCIHPSGAGPDEYDSAGLSLWRIVIGPPQM